MAIADSESGVYKSVRKAILAYSIPLSILSDWLGNRLLKRFIVRDIITVTLGCPQGNCRTVELV